MSDAQDRRSACVAGNRLSRGARQRGAARCTAATATPLLRASRAASSGLLALLLAACGTAPQRAQPDAADQRSTALALPVATVAERFVTADARADEIDSVATWRSAAGATWLLATAKSGARVLVYDAVTGSALGALAPRPGDPPLLRPNGIAVAGDVALVVDQERARVEMIRLPDGARLGAFGAGLLRTPYGIWAQADGDGGFDVYVTDSYRQPDGSFPPPAELDRRVHHFHLDRDLQARTVRAFGETHGSGMLLTVESVAADPRHRRLLVAEEQVEAGSGLREYRTDGRYTGTSIAGGIFAWQAEGIALVACADGEGFWIASDQHHEHQRFHVFDRASLRWLGAFRGRVAADTDGLAYAPPPLPGFPAGALYAQHDNRAVVAFDWAEVARALDLPAHCHGAATG